MRSRWVARGLVIASLASLLVWGCLERRRAKTAEGESKRYRDQVYFICHRAAALIEDEGNVQPQSVQAFSTAIDYCLYATKAWGHLGALLEDMRNYDGTHDPSAARKEMAELIRSQLPP